MKQVRAVLAILFAVFLVWLFYWALFSPKEDISARIYKTIKEQEKHPDLSYNKVTFEEISDNNKFWQLNAESAIVNKDTGIATLKETIGTFFRAGKEVLRFRAPAALWDMKKKEIYLDQPLGYDISSEKEALTSSKKNGNNSLFNFNPGSENRNKYWFQAKNLSWRMLDQKIFCDGGIIVKKGNITGYANSLTGDVEFNEVKLNGLPHVEINNPKNATVYISAESFELRRKDDSLFAYGNPTIRWKEAVVVSKSAKYLQNKQLLSLAENVFITYKDISASGNMADYQTNDQTVLLTGDARARQGNSDLQSDKIMVSLKDNKISLLGGSNINIIEEVTNEPETAD